MRPLQSLNENNRPIVKIHINGLQYKICKSSSLSTLLRQLDFCTLVNRNIFANHYLKVPMFLVAHFFPMACQNYFDEAHFSLREEVAGQHRYSSSHYRQVAIAC